MACKLRKRNSEIHECDGCAGPEELTAEIAEERREEKKMETKDNISAVSLRSRSTGPEDLRCKTDGCDNPIKGTGKTGLCRNCSMKLAQKKCHTSESIRKSINTRKKRYQGGYTSFDKNKSNNVISLDFSDYPELLNALRVAAKDEFRNIEQEIFYILDTRMKKESQLLTPNP